MVKLTAEIVRTWSDELLNDHLLNCRGAKGYVCPGCAKLNRQAFEAEAIQAGVVTANLVDGWL